MNISETFSVKDKVVIITGALGLLGSQYGCAFAENGARVVVLEAKIDSAKFESIYGNYSNRVLAVEADVTRRTELESALSKIQAHWETPHVLINNAALDSPPHSPAEENGPFETYPEASWDKVMEVNLKGVFLCCQVFGEPMAKAGRGSIINISSIYGMVSPDQRIYEYRATEGASFFKPVAYSASKSGLFNLTRYLATYWAKKGVRVNTVTLAGALHNQDEQFLKNYCVKVPLARMAQKGEFDGLMIFLASEASSYITGSNITADGGYTAW